MGKPMKNYSKSTPVGGDLGTSTKSIGILAYHGKPVPVQYLKRWQSNGEVRITKPADPEKVAAYRASLAQ